MDKTLQIRKVKSYQKADYPRYNYKIHSKHPLVKTITASGSAMLFSSLLIGCDDDKGAVMGYMLSDDMLTETEARAVIDRVFERNNISLTKDYPLVVFWSENDARLYNLDGYNTETKIGYEYICHDLENEIETRDQDFNEFELNGGRNYFEYTEYNDGEQVIVVDGVLKYGDLEAIYAELEEHIQEFIDSLRAEGKI